VTSIGIDEGKIESIDRLILEPFQGIASRSDHDLDLFRNPRSLPMGATDIGPLLFYIAG
jgi:hypothetical protein